jgi:hypothetical protein
VDSSTEVPSRQNAVVKGEIPLAEAEQKYSMSLDEINQLVELYARRGLKALRATRLQEYR